MQADKRDVLLMHQIRIILPDLPTNLQNGLKNGM